MNCRVEIQPLKVLIACETSGIIRNAFLRRGHDAWSCDLLASEDNSNRHIRGDARDFLREGWDLLMVAHPPCTRLCNSGVRWLSVPPPGKTVEQMQQELEEGAALFSDFWNAPIGRICVENPVMHKHAKALIRGYQPFAQSFQPWEFADDEQGPDNVKKRTCLWLRNLPKLTPTGRLDGSSARDEIHTASPGPGRWKARSRFFPGAADAMADQWGALPILPADAAPISAYNQMQLF